VNFTVDIRAMDDQVRETIVTSFSRLVLQKCDDRLVDCKVEHKVRRSTESAFMMVHDICRCGFCAAESSLTLGVVWHQHSAAATHCDPELTSQLKRAARSTVSTMPGRTAAAAGETPVLMSGAGHDAMAMARLTKVTRRMIAW
jgi:allantoate deiminase